MKIGRQLMTQTGWCVLQMVAGVWHQGHMHAHTYNRHIQTTHKNMQTSNSPQVHSWLRQLNEKVTDTKTRQYITPLQSKLSSLTSFTCLFCSSTCSFTLHRWLTLWAPLFSFQLFSRPDGAKEEKQSAYEQLRNCFTGMEPTQKKIPKPINK